MNTVTVRRIVRASAVYDLLATAAFAVPVTAAAALGGIGAVQHALGLSGVVPSAGDPITILLADLLGSIVVVWSVVRLVLPAPVLGAADTVARALFCAWFGWALAHGASPVLAAFLVVEVVWLAVQGYAVLGPLRNGATGITELDRLRTVVL